MFASHNTKARSAFLAATIAALLIAFSPNLYAQSPLTVQPSTGRIGVAQIRMALLSILFFAFRFEERDMKKSNN